MKRGDIPILLAVLLLAAVAAFFWRTPGPAVMVVVTWDGAVLARLPLTGPAQEYVYGDHGQVRVAVENGRARFAASDCPDQLCVQSGWLSVPGRVAACLPNRCLLEIQGDAEPDTHDVVIGAPYAPGETP